MPSRSTILNKVRQALRVPAPRPSQPFAKEVFPPIPPVELVPWFQKELQALKGEFHQSRDWMDAQAWLSGVMKENGFSKVVASSHPDVQEAVREINGKVICDEKNCGHHLESADLGITFCDCLVACTGSVVLTARTGFGRALSVLPPAHMVIARRSQLVAQLSDAFALLEATYGGSQKTGSDSSSSSFGLHSKPLQPDFWPSMITIISGPSRTADIEKIMVLGAHGPKKLFVLLLDF